MFMSSPKERIKQFIEYKGISIAEFERTAQLGNGSINKPTARMQGSTLRLIEDAYPELDINWVRTGQGTMIKKQPEHSIRDINGNQNLVQNGSHPSMYKDIKINIEEEINLDDENILSLEDAKKRISHLNKLLYEAEKRIIKLEGKIEQQNETIKLLAGK